jgi:hypothetical protein
MRKVFFTLTALTMLTGSIGIIPSMTAQAQDYNYNSVPQSDLDRALSNPPPASAENNGFSTEVNRGNYYGGLGSGAYETPGSGTFNTNGNPNEGITGFHVGRHY